jgi:hypothetical protein
MDRGPAALFGAIVAVGLGPAMWLGVRLGAVEVAPSKPPAVVGEHTSGPDRLLGGTGAGDDSPLGEEPEVAATPRGRVLPPTKKPSPSATSTSPVATTSATPSSTPSTDQPTTPPTESTTAPTAPSTGTSTTSSAPPPAPPAGGGSSEGPGAGLAPSGSTGSVG